MSCPDGLLVVDKPVGPTSHDVVAWARRALGTRRVGHAGTLDPAASGVLPLLLGRATRLAQFLASGEKEYLATVAFGKTSNTYDGAGTIVETGGQVTRAAVEQALGHFRGAFAQTPPPFSAKKIDGVRAYLLARDERPVLPKPVTVNVHRLELVDFAPGRAMLQVTCSAGFYVRSLAHDLGQHLGTGALLEALQRVRSGRFVLAGATTIEELNTVDSDDLFARVEPMAAMLSGMAAAVLTEEGANRASHGREVGLEHVVVWPAAEVGGPVQLLTRDGQLLGVATMERMSFLHPSVVLS